MSTQHGACFPRALQNSILALNSLKNIIVRKTILKLKDASQVQDEK